MQAYRYARGLTPAQQRLVAAHAGAARFAYNWALARVKAVLDQRAAERSYGIPDTQLTPALGWTLPALCRAWNTVKVAPWWGEVSKEVFNTGLDALARGLKNWADSRAGKRAGWPVGFPRFKARRRATPSVRFTTGAVRVEPDPKHVVPPRLGRLKLHESVRKLARRLQAGTARILSAAVRRDPRHLDAALARMRALGRALSRKSGPDRRTGRRASRRWDRAAARLGRAHVRVAHLRAGGCEA
jgi:transposase